jgi:hypothetical protein
MHFVCSSLSFFEKRVFGAPFHSGGFRDHKIPFPFFVACFLSEVAARKQVQ